MDMNEFQTKADLCLEYYNEVMSGGHWKYFYQNVDEGFKDYQMVVEALISIGAKKQAKTLTKAITIRNAEIKLIANGADEDEINKFQDKYSKLDEELDCEPSVVQLLENAFEKIEKKPVSKGTLIEQYIKQAEIVRSINNDFTDSRNLLRNNRAVTKMHEIATIIEKGNSAQKEEFEKLLDINDLRNSVAWKIFYSMNNYSEVAQKKALGIIKKMAANKNSLNAFPAKMALKEWREKNSKANKLQ